MEISSADYQRFKTILETQSGILLGENKQYLVVSRLSHFIREQKISSFSGMLDRISSPSGGILLKQVVDLMTTNETLWFRDRYPFEYLKSTIIPELRKKSSSIRVWSAACSTGQEPYSIAINMEEMGLLSSIDITASDLSERVLTKARQGIYQKIELNRGMPDVQLKRFFVPHGDSDWQIDRRLSSKIRFQPINLLNTPYKLSKFDVIFCRNVLIYFSGENKTRVLNGLIDNLNPGGYLFLGASEALTRDSRTMKMIRCNPGLVYQKEK